MTRLKTIEYKHQPLDIEYHDEKFHPYWNIRYGDVARSCVITVGGGLFHVETYCNTLGSFPSAHNIPSFKKALLAAIIVGVQE
jgi:hypothetical protein